MKNGKPQVSKVKDSLSSNLGKLSRSLNKLHPADIAGIVHFLEEKEKIKLFGQLNKKLAYEVFDELDETEQAHLIKYFENKEAKEMLSQMPPDELADLFEATSNKEASRLYQLIDKEKRSELKELLTYPEDSAGAIMTTEYVAFSPEFTAGEAIKKIRKIAPRKETVYFNYIINKFGKLIGFVSLKDIVLANTNQKLEEIMHTNVISVNLKLDQEKVAKNIQKYDLIAIPVVDDANRLHGIVTVDDVIDVVEEETTEDVYKMASIESLDKKYFNAKFMTLARKRVTWLTILLFTYTISTALLKHYSPTLEVAIGLAYFIPMLTGSGGNAGTQTATLVIRGIAVGEIKFKQIFKVLKREIGMGLILGSFLGILGGIRAVTMEKSPILSLTVGLALISSITVATLTGSVVPLLLRKIKLDPAIAAGPFLTTIIDVAAIIIYFEIAKLLLSS